MGYETENEARMKAFVDWCVDADMMAARARTPSSCTACRRTAAREVEAEVIDGPQSVVWGRGGEQDARAEGTDGVPAARRIG